MPFHRDSRIGKLRDFGIQRKGFRRDLAERRHLEDHRIAFGNACSRDPALQRETPKRDMKVAGVAWVADQKLSERHAPVIDEVCQETMFFQGTDRGSDDDPVVVKKKRPQQRGRGGRNCCGFLPEAVRGRNHIHPLQVCSKTR